MDTRRIGSLEVSVVGLGCNNFGRRIDEAATREVVHAALDAGITFFDTADIYGTGKSEEFLGRALGTHRRQVVLASKFGSPMDEQRKGAKPDYLRRAVDDSLKRLGTDRIDLYQLHTPDEETPIAETLEALDGLVKAGKVREIGCSNFSVEQLREADRSVKLGRARFVSVQNEYSLLHRDPEKGVLAECERLGLAVHPVLPALERAPDRQVPSRPAAASGHAPVRRPARRHAAHGPQPRDRRAADRIRGGAAPPRCSSWRCRGCCRARRQ